MTIDERLNVIIGELQQADITLTQAEEQFRRRYMAVALKATRGNITRAAKLMGIHRNTLGKYLRRFHGLRSAAKSD